ncbi:MAG: PH domain-containing protein [Gammaproteobacteria bacterium]|nr:PH domain-containing protein [Gammaproteobacteria bacterium]
MGTEAKDASPEPAVFRTTFGFQVFVTLAVVCMNLFIVTQFPPLDGVSFAILALSVASVILMVYSMLSTKYRVVDGVLHLHQGPFSRSVDLKSISRIRVGGTLFRGTLYGLGIRGGVSIYYSLGVYRDRVVVVTPKYVDGFLAAIGARRTESGDVEIAR